MQGQGLQGLQSSGQIELQNRQFAADQKLVRGASRAKWGPLLKEGVKIYEYQPTMFHCKLLIVDRQWVSLGSSNLDNRSFRLNFEITMGVSDREVASQVRTMLESDFANAERITAADLHARTFAFRLAVRAARLASPVQ